MSRGKPGYLTDFNAFLTCSSEIDISAPYACRATGKPRARAQQGQGASACPENASPARTDGRGNAEGAIRRQFSCQRVEDARSTKVAIKFIDPGNPSCSESDIRFRQRGEKAARPLSLQSPGFASRTRHGISSSLDWPAA